MEVKQVIVVRKDLNMRKGKLAAQVAHASMKVLVDGIWQLPGGMTKWAIELNEDMERWLAGAFTKIVVGVNSEKELMGLYVDVQLAELPHALILDAGKTEFKEPTYTALAIGPVKEEEVDKLTGNLQLL